MPRIRAIFVAFEYVSTKTSGGLKKRGRKRYIRNKERVREWLIRRLMENGCSTVNVTTVDLCNIRINGKLKFATPVPVARVVADVEIADSKKFKHICRSRIGTLKCCGYGQIDILKDDNYVISEFTVPT